MSRRRADVLVAALIAAVAVVLAVRLLVLATAGTRPRRGDGRTVASYGFDLANLDLPHGELVPAGMPRDGVRALVTPDVWTAARMDAQRKQRRAPRLVPSDLVIGAVLDGHPRAWPLRFLVWHEVVNDELAGMPLLVVHHALSGFSAVFERRLADGRTPTFGVSGLLWNSGLILYDRAPEGESLWSPLLARAIAGPAAERHATLRLMPSQVVTWADWRAQHPATTVLAPDPTLSREYRREPFGSYLGSDLLRYPVEPRWPWEFIAKKTPTLVVSSGDGAFLAIPLPAAAARADRGVVAVPESNPPLLLRVTTRPATVVLVGPESPVPSLVAFAFAWHAAHPHDTHWLMP
mgnify:CR=1 FL=1